MAVEKTGSAYLGSLYSTSTSVIVPADATLAILYGKYYTNPTGAILLGATSATLVKRIGDASDRPICDLWYIINPSTGSQTLYYRTSEGISDPYYAGAVFFKGVDTSSPIISSASTMDNSNITTLIAPVGSMMVGIAAGYYNVPTVTNNSQTQLVLEDWHGFGAALKAESTSFYFSGTNQNAAALTIAAAVSVSDPPFLFNPSNRYAALLVQ